VETTVYVLSEYAIISVVFYLYHLTKIFVTIAMLTNFD